MDIERNGADSQEESEFKGKAAEILKSCGSGLMTFGGSVWDFSKKAYSAARDKIKEMDERQKESSRIAQEEEEKRRRMYEERMREAAQCGDGGRPAGASDLHPGQAARRSRYRGDPSDKSFLMSYGWLFFVWWVMNFIDTGLCLWWFVSATNSPYTRDTAWIALLVLGLALLFNRLAYEAAVAFFEMVRHLRQIRDELCRHNMREEEKWNEMRERESSGETQAQGVEQTALDGGDESHKGEHAAEATR